MLTGESYYFSQNVQAATLRKKGPETKIEGLGREKCLSQKSVTLMVMLVIFQLTIKENNKLQL